MLINNKSSQGSQTHCPSKTSLMPLCLTTADSAACVPVFIHLRKYHPKPHLSCIGCSTLTFHFVWQTLIFTSKVLSRRYPDSCIAPCVVSQEAAWEGIAGTHALTHTHRGKLREMTVFEGRLNYCQICWIRTLVGMKCENDELIKAEFLCACFVAYLNRSCSHCAALRGSYIDSNIYKL